MPIVRVGDIDIYYEILGNGNPLLMIMGLKFSLLDWGENYCNNWQRNIK